MRPPIEELLQDEHGHSAHGFITPTTANHGVATTFTAHVTEPAGITTIAWKFGDGVSATTTSVGAAITTQPQGARPDPCR